MSLSVPILDIEDLEISPVREEKVEDRKGAALKLGIIGSGQCGGRIAREFQRIGYAKSIYFNTTDQDVTDIRYKYIMKMANNPGGAGKNIELANEVYTANQGKVYSYISEVFGEVDHIIIAAGLGGGTGSGTVLPLVNTAKKYLNSLGNNGKVGVIATLPSYGESSSPIVRNNALKIASELSKLADNSEISPLIMFDNEKLAKMYKNLTVAQFYPAINSSVAQFVDAFNIIAGRPSEFITFDSTDFKSTFTSGGHMLYGLTSPKDINKDNSVADALNENLNSSLMASGFDLTTAKSAATVVLAGPDLIESVPGLMDKIIKGFDAISAITGNATVHRGVYSDENAMGKLRIFSMISGLSYPKARYSQLSY